MNRRSFIGGVLLAAIAPTILIPKLKDSFKWKRTENWVLVPNREYDIAPYEVGFLVGSEFVGSECYPIRHKECPPIEISTNTKLYRQWISEHHIPPFIRQRA